MTWTLMPHRGLLSLKGPDRKTFLQGLITNDISKLSSTLSLYTAFLSPQGKFLHDLFITEKDDILYLEGERERLPDLLKRLTLFKLRADVTLSLEENLQVLASFSQEDPASGFMFFSDPRPASLQNRAYCDAENIPKNLDSFELYNQKRLQLGLPEGSWDMTPDKAIPLECGLDDLGAIDWKKGCYMGQELTARTKHRGLIRKRFLPCKAPFLLSNQHETLLQGDKKVGTLLSFSGPYGLVRLRLEALENKTPIMLDNQPVTLTIPEWMKGIQQSL